MSDHRAAYAGYLSHMSKPLRTDWRHITAESIRHIRDHPPIRIIGVRRSADYVTVADVDASAAPAPPATPMTSSAAPPRPSPPKLARLLPHGEGRPVAAPVFRTMASRHFPILSPICALQIRLYM